jgi:hypothetical protein
MPQLNVLSTLRPGQLLPEQLVRAVNGAGKTDGGPAL